MSSRRSLQTILFTDIVSSTERAIELGDRGWRDLLAEHHEFVRRALRRYHGQEIATAGDGFLVVFDTAEWAILCAQAIREGVRDLDLEVRCGLHMGEVERTAEGDLGGIAVHVGARVAAEAAPGEILVTSGVRDAELGSGFGFEDCGRRDLKGVPGQWRLFAVTHVPEGIAPPPRSIWIERIPRRVIAGAIAVAAVLGLAGLYVVIQHRGESFSPDPALAEAAPAIAILPFRVADSDLDIWREGMVDLLSTNLDGAGGLRAINSRTVLAQWMERTGGDTAPANLEAALDVAAATGARYALIGSTISLGSTLRFVAEIYEVDGGARVGEARVEGSPDNLAELVDRLSIDVLALLLEEEEVEPFDIGLASITTSSVSALKAFLKGEAELRRSNFEEAAQAYQTAIRADTTFALAYYRLTWAYGWIEGGSERRQEALRHALRLRERLPRREALFAEAGLALDRGFLDGLPILRKATRQYPDDAEGWYQLGETYYHLPQALAELEDAEAAFERATNLQPRFLPYRIHLVDLTFSNRPDSIHAAEELAAYRELTVESDQILRSRQVAFDLAFGSLATRDRALDTLDTLDLSVLGPALGVLNNNAGFWETSKRVLDEYEDRIGRTLYGMRVLDFLIWGKLEEALEYAEGHDPPGWYRPCLLYHAYLLGGDIDEERLTAALAIAPADTAGGEGGNGLFCKGGYAADRGNWADHAEAGTRLRTDAQRNFAAGDSTSGRKRAAEALALDGYGRWKQGSSVGALPMLEEAIGDAGERHELRLWLGQLLLELARPRDALPYFRSFRYQPSAARFAGQAYEGFDRWENARQAYEEFAIYWADADPAFQPLVEEARQAVSRLQGLKRE